MGQQQGMRITVSTAMRARDVSRPTEEHAATAEEIPLRADPPGPRAEAVQSPSPTPSAPPTPPRKRNRS